MSWIISLQYHNKIIYKQEFTDSKTAINHWHTGVCKINKNSKSNSYKIKRQKHGRIILKEYSKQKITWHEIMGNGRKIKTKIKTFNKKIVKLLAYEKLVDKGSILFWVVISEDGVGG